MDEMPLFCIQMASFWCLWSEPIPASLTAHLDFLIWNFISAAYHISVNLILISHGLIWTDKEKGFWLYIHVLVTYTLVTLFIIIFALCCFPFVLEFGCRSWKWRQSRVEHVPVVKSEKQGKTEFGFVCCITFSAPCVVYLASHKYTLVVRQIGSFTLCTAAILDSQARVGGAALTFRVGSLELKILPVNSWNAPSCSE